MSYENPTTRCLWQNWKPLRLSFFCLDFLNFCDILCLEIQIGHLVDVLWWHSSGTEFLFFYSTIDFCVVYDIIFISMINWYRRFGLTSWQTQHWARRISSCFFYTIYGAPVGVGALRKHACVHVFSGRRAWPRPGFRTLGWESPHTKIKTRQKSCLHGAPVGIRTQDLSFRRRTLYPAELRVRKKIILKFCNCRQQDLQSVAL